MKNKKWWQFWIKSEKTENPTNPDNPGNWNIVGNEKISQKFIIPVGKMDPEEAKEKISSLISHYSEEILFDNEIKNLILPNNTENSNSEDIEINENGTITFKKEYWLGPTNGDVPNIEFLPDDKLNEREIVDYFYSKLSIPSKIPVNRFKDNKEIVFYYTWELHDDGSWYLRLMDLSDPIETVITIPSNIIGIEFLQLEKLGPGKRSELYIEQLFRKYLNS